MKILFLMLFSAPAFLYGQKNKAFKITGHSDFYNNKSIIVSIGILPHYYNDFIFTDNKADSSQPGFKTLEVRDKIFSVNGIQAYPHPVVISYYDAENNAGHSSDFFFIDADTINLNLDNLSGDRDIGRMMNSPLNKEYRYLRILFSAAVDTITREIIDLEGKQKTMAGYITQNPNSYVALWDLVMDCAAFKTYRKNDELRMILNNAGLFSPEIKKTKTWQALVKNINQDLSLIPGKAVKLAYLDADLGGDKIFPNIPLNATDSLIPVIKNNKFTLLDFWFSACKPCISQFPRYKIIYDLNKNKGFEIIGISVDRKEKEADWRNIIRTSGLNWKQYIDSNEIITEQLHINYFPTNFLLDQTGKIIKKDISQDELEIFLKENLN